MWTSRPCHRRACTLPHTCQGPDFSQACPIACPAGTWWQHHPSWHQNSDKMLPSTISLSDYGRNQSLRPENVLQAQLKSPWAWLRAGGLLPLHRRGGQSTATDLRARSPTATGAPHGTRANATSTVPPEAPGAQGNGVGQPARGTLHRPSLPQLSLRGAAGAGRLDAGSNGRAVSPPGQSQVAAGGAAVGFQSAALGSTKGPSLQGRDAKKQPAAGASHVNGGVTDHGRRNATPALSSGEKDKPGPELGRHGYTTPSGRPTR